MLQNKKDNPTIRIFSRGNGEYSVPTEIYNNSCPNTIYRSALEAFVNPKQQIDKKLAKEQIQVLYRLKQQRKASDIEYSSLKKLENLFELYKYDIR